MNLRTPAILFAALIPTACSGATPYSTSFSREDVAYATTLILDVSATIQFLEGSTRHLYVTGEGDGPASVNVTFLRRGRADVTAFSGALIAADLRLPDQTEIARRMTSQFDGDGARLSHNERATRVDEAVVSASRAYIDVGRSATIRYLARRAIESRNSIKGGPR